MSVNKRSLTICLPGLIWPVADVTHLGLEWPDLPFTRKLLSLGDWSSVAGTDEESTLMQLFAITPPEAGTDWPSGALMARSEGIKCCWALRAAPIHLRADIDKALVFDSTSFDIDKDEAMALAEAFNQHFAEDGVKLQVLQADQWLLLFDEAPQLQTWPLEAVVGKNMDPFLPTGPDATRWHGFLNEIQMLFFTHPVNRQRQQQGQLPVNGLWLWGGGALETMPTADFDVVCGYDPLMHALGHGATISCQSRLPSPQSLWQPHWHKALLKIDNLAAPARFGDVDQWLHALSALEESWMKPLYEALRQHQVDEVHILPCQGDCITLKPADLRRFWRRSQPLSRFMH